MGASRWFMVGAILSACSGEDKLTANNTHPEALITSHGAEDTVREGGEVNFVGSVSDTEDGPDQLLATWLIDDEITCEGAAPDADGRTSCTVTAGAGENIEVRLEVRDSKNALAADGRVLAIQSTSEPTVEITVPEDSFAAAAGEPIAFSAIASDAEDSPEDLVLWWESSLDGRIEIADVPDSSGVVSGQLTDLSQGAHSMVLWVEDTDGKTGKDTLSIVINSSPSCAITAPEDGAAFVIGETVLFEGTVDDVEQAADTLSVSWSSDKDGALGSSAPSSSGEVAFGTDGLSSDIHTVTMEVMDEQSGSCSSFVVITIEGDVDRDGFTEEEGDCDDSDASIHPDATDTWYDGVDSDCDGASDYDADGDGYRSDAFSGDDCDDADASVHPGATDAWYDGVDSDCGGESDFDADGDGYSSDAHGGDDCDDADATIHPGATDTWYDGVDSDCGGESDLDADGDGYTSDAHGGDDCDDTDASIHPDAADPAYDGIDSDCDGEGDYDADGDGYLSDAYGGDDCDDSDSSIHPGASDAWYDGVDSDCGGEDDNDADGDGHASDAHGGDDCDDSDSSLHPGATDAWYDGVDSDCGGDDDYDADIDGYISGIHGGDDCDDTDGAIHPGAWDAWYDGVDSDCGGEDDDDADADGYASDAHGGDDCDDADAATYPGAADTWYDGVDSDCGGEDDFDADGDGYASFDHGGEDCDDTDPDALPGTETLEGPGLSHDIGGHPNSGLQFRALETTVLESFVFNNQGGTDTITLYDATTDLIVESVDLAPAAGALLVTAGWPLEAGHTYRLTNEEASNGRWDTYSGFPATGETLAVDGAWTYDALNTDYWFTFTELSTTGCPEEPVCEEYVFEGPVLTTDISGWPDSGLQFVALFDTTLDSFVFNNQGSADTITLYDATTGTTLGTIGVGPGSAAEFVISEWALEEGHTYRLTSALNNNGRWAPYSDFPEVGEALEVEGAWGTSGIHTSSWHTFTELTTSVCED